MRPDKPLVLGVGQSAVIAEGLTVTVAHEVNDSRCPKGARCAWPGEVRMTLLIQDGDGPRKEAALSLPTSRPGGATATVAGHSVTLTKVTPPRPAADATIPRADYRFTFEVG